MREGMMVTEEQKEQLEWLYRWNDSGEKYVFVSMLDILTILGIKYEIQESGEFLIKSVMGVE